MRFRNLLLPIAALCLMPAMSLALENRHAVGHWMGFSRPSGPQANPALLDLSLSGNLMEGELGLLLPAVQRIRVSGRIYRENRMILIGMNEEVLFIGDGSVRSFGDGSVRPQDDAGLASLNFTVYFLGDGSVRTGNLNLLHSFGLDRWNQMDSPPFLGMHEGTKISEKFPELGAGPHILGTRGELGSAFFGNFGGGNNAPMFFGTKMGDGSVRILCDGSVMPSAANSPTCDLYWGKFRQLQQGPLLLNGRFQTVGFAGLNEFPQGNKGIIAILIGL